MKAIHYPNNIRSHLITITQMAPYTQNQLQSSDLLCTLDIYSHPMRHPVSLKLSVSKILMSILITLLTIITVCVVSIYCTQ